MVIRWGQKIADPGGIRHQWHHVIDIVPTILEAAGVPHPDTVNGVAQQPIEGVSLAYTFGDAEAPDQRTTQYFEMVGNRGIYHEGWTASTQHGIPWEMVDERERPFDQDVWELYDTTKDWTQSHDLAAEQPEQLARLRELFDAEAGRHQVFPLDDRVTERENPQEAGRLDLHGDRQHFTFGATTKRLTEEAAPNVKNRSHAITAEIEVIDDSTGVLVAQGGRFGGWSLYLHEGVPRYAYNNMGRDLTVITAREPLTPGRHSVRMEFSYAGGPPGSGAAVRLLVDEEQVAEGELASTTAFYFSFDETFNVGVDRGTPVVDDYVPVSNRFTGRLHRVEVDLAQAGESGTPEELHRAWMTHH